MNFPSDQYEAAQSVGMQPGQGFRRIVLHRSVRVSLPGLVNEMSLLIKVTPVLAVVGVVDITRPRQDWRPDLRAAAAASGGDSAVRADRVCAGVAAALDRRRQIAARGRRMIRDFGHCLERTRTLAFFLSGLANTAILSTLAAIAALLLGFILTPALMSKRRLSPARHACS